MCQEYLNKVYHAVILYSGSSFNEYGSEIKLLPAGHAPRRGELLIPGSSYTNSPPLQHLKLLPAGHAPHRGAPLTPGELLH